MSCKHPQLFLRKFDDHVAFICNGCRELGYGTCYNCCNIHLHKQCLAASQTPTNPTKHPFFNQKLSFTVQIQSSPDTKDFCTACGLTVKGLRYYSHERGRITYLHPCCMKLPHEILTEGGDKLRLTKKLETLRCYHCTRGDDGWAYVSVDKEVVCHVKCMKDILLENWEYKRFQRQWSDHGPSTSNQQRHFQSSQYHHHHHHSLPMRERILGRIMQATFGVFLHVAIGDLISGDNSVIISGLGNLFGSGFMG